MIAALINLIIYLIVLGLLYWLVIHVIDTIPIPDPPNRFIKLALMVLLVLVVIVLLLELLGSGVGGVNLPRLTE